MSSQSRYLTERDWLPLVAARAGLTQRVVSKAIHAWRDVLAMELANGHAVRWFGMGKFYPHVEFQEDWGCAVADSRRYKIAVVRFKTGRTLRARLLPLADRNLTAGMVKMGRVITPGAVKGRLHKRIAHAERQLTNLSRVIGDDERGREVEARLAEALRKGKQMAKKKKLA